jgi:septal ring factor EnvC (AmiA/AmiB activator)
MQQTSQERQETQLEQLLMRFAKQNESLSQVSNALQALDNTANKLNTRI